jgi:hypothetical protein
MSQMLLCMGVAASFATLCATLSYGYLVLDRVVQADEARRPSFHRPSLASDTPPDAFAQLSTSSRFRSAGIGLVHLDDPYQDGPQPSHLSLVESESLERPDRADRRGRPATAARGVDTPDPSERDCA